MAKRKLPPVLKAWRDCREQMGVKPFKKMSRKAYSETKACVLKKMKRAGK